MCPIDAIVDLIWPREPGEPDRAAMWEKLLAIALLATMIALYAAVR
jgi:hypothetical protein